MIMGEPRVSSFRIVSQQTLTWPLGRTGSSSRSNTIMYRILLSEGPASETGLHKKRNRMNKNVNNPFLRMMAVISLFIKY